LWTVVRQANQQPAEGTRAAQQQLLDLYGGAIRRYLLGALRDEEAAEELFQEFALCLLQGNLAGADPNRGRFRDFVKGVLAHLIAKSHRRGRRRPRAFGSRLPEPVVPPPSHSELDQHFLNSWRDELLARCWADLSAIEHRTEQAFYTVLRFRAEHPDLSSAQMAADLSTTLGRPLTAASVRQTLHRARERFANLLLQEVAQSLHEPTPEDLEEELLELGLLEHCRPALQRRCRPSVKDDR
jgi:RNA polymerase sigma-70 factor (ECF subfamily)